jgi:hypothetical protein
MTLISAKHKLDALPNEHFDNNILQQKVFTKLK